MSEIIKTHKELKVFQLSFEAGMEIFRLPLVRICNADDLFPGICNAIITPPMLSFLIK